MVSNLHIFSSVILRVSFAALSFVTVAVMARYLPPEVFGQYTLYLSIFTLAIIPFTSGVSKFNVRQLAKGSVRVERLLNEQRYLVIFLVVASVIVSVNLLLFHYNLDLILLVVLFPLAVLINAEMSCLRGLGHHLSGNIDALFLRPIILLFLVIVCIGFDVSVTTSILIYIFVLAYILARVVVHPWVHLPVYKPRSPRLMGTTRVKKMVGMLTLIGSAEVISVNLDLFFLGYLSNVTDVAAYKVAISIRNVALLPTMSFNLFLPFLMAKIAQSTFKRDINFQIKILVKISCFFAFLYAGMYFLFGERLISEIFGEHYTSSYYLVFPLLGGIIIAALCGPVVERLIGLGAEKDVLGIVILSLAVSGALNVLLIPTFGALGAAIASSCGYILLNLMACAVLKFKYGFSVGIFMFFCDEKSDTQHLL